MFGKEMISLNFILVIGLTFAIDIPGCPQRLPNNDGLVVNGDYCYHFVHAEKYWTDAREFCHDLQGDMLTLDSSDLNVFIKRQIIEIGWDNDGVWIGLNDRKDEGSWRWESRIGGGDVALWTNWASGHPSGFLNSDRDCVYMDRDDNWRWHEDHCSGFLFSEERRFICQYEYTAPTTIAAAGTTIVPNAQPLQTVIQNDRNTLTYVGLGMGLLILVLLVIAGIFFLLWRKNKRKRCRSTTSEVTQASDNQAYESHHSTDLYQPRPSQTSFTNHSCDQHGSPPPYKATIDDNAVNRRNEASELPEKMKY